MTDADFDRTDRAIVNAFQGGFPVVEQPYEPAAAALRDHGVAITAEELCARIRTLVEDDVFSRFGTLVDASAIGGEASLVAMAVPEDRFEEVTETVNGYREVAHNYERDHSLNMWFVLSVADPERVDGVLASIERETGLDSYNLPKMQEFELKALFPVEGPVSEGDVDLSDLGPDVTTADRDVLRPRERDLVVELQDGFPLTLTPYADIADAIGTPTDWVLRTVQRFLAEGRFRRVGVVPNHYALGYTENPMTVWDVPDQDVETVGRAVASLPFVTHCYERPRHEGVWPYNLFAMVHGRSPEGASERVEQVRETVFARCGPVDNDRVDSTRILKKTGIRLAERAAANTEVSKDSSVVGE
ncbi:siroheme decarboxylase subunit beta [Halovenus sp. HT40]|uniref:siroheme decarboxylase subunit beta n=1 Tax=Halovenus sp. HT40 TaxID=3126691 RepID=UPI00300F37FD